MSASWRWASSDLRKRKFAVAVLGLLIAVSFGASMALVAGARRAGSATDRFVTASDIAPVTIFFGSGPTPEMLEALAADPRIERTQRSDLVIVTPDPAVPGDDGFTAIGEAGTVAGGLGTPMLLSGRYPDPEATDEILANERAAQEFGLKAGQRTTLSALACFDCTPATLTGEVTITGIVRLANDLVDDPSTVGLYLAPSGFLDGAWVGQFRPGSIIWVYLQEGADALEVSQSLSPFVIEGDVSNNISSLKVVGRSGNIQRNALLIAAAVVALVTILVVGHAMMRFVSIRQADEPVLGALGMSSTERWGAAAMVLAPAAIAGSVAAPIVAYALSPIFPIGRARRAEVDPGTDLDLLVIGLGTIATIVVVAAATTFAARRWIAADQSPRLKPDAATLALGALNLPLVPLTGARFALEQGGRGARPPTRSTVLAVATAMIIIVGSVVLRASLTALNDTPSRYGSPWAMHVAGEEDLDALATDVSADPRVASVDLVSQGEVDLVTASGKQAQVGALGIEGVTKPAPVGVLEGHTPSDTEIALGTITMQDLGVEVGDVVTASGPCGTFPLTVSGRAIVPLVGGDTPDEGSVVTFDTYDALCADELIADIDISSGVFVRLHDDSQAQVVADDLMARGHGVQLSTRPSSVGALIDIREVTAIVAAVVGVLGVAAAAYSLVLSVRRRRTELAVLRALGLGPRQAGRVLVAQALALVLVAAAIGVPLGIVLGRWMWNAIATPFNVFVRTEVGLAVPIAAAALALPIVLISLWPSWRARRLDVATALRGE